MCVCQKLIQLIYNWIAGSASIGLSISRGFVLDWKLQRSIKQKLLATGNTYTAAARSCKVSDTYFPYSPFKLG